MMPTNKAVKLLKDYKNNNYNAKKTLLDNGYSEQTANKASKVILARADKAVKSKLPIEKDTDIKDTSTNVLDLLGYDREDVVKMLREVVEQNRDYSNKLKAMQPMLRALNYNIEDIDSNKSMPNVTIKLGDKVTDGLTKPPIEADTV